tara:strand:+ start:2243 stop:3007 length:765 start_codon:yes stop_codon:yes gene_type:complete
VVFIHGIGRSLEDFAGTQDDLSTDFDTIAFDLPGSGWSSRSDEQLGLQVLARAVREILDALKVTEPAHLVGNSLGGAVAMTVAANESPRVRSMTLVDSAGFGRDVTLSLRLLAVRPVGAALLRPSVSNATRVTREMFGDRSLVTPELVAHAYRLSQRPDFARSLLDVASDLGTFWGVRSRWRRHLLSTVSAMTLPTLIVWGSADVVLPPKHLRAAMAALPQSQGHVFEGAGHMPQIERRAEFSTMLRNFLDEQQ